MENITDRFFSDSWHKVRRIFHFIFEVRTAKHKREYAT